MTKTRNEKIKNFFIKIKKLLYQLSLIIILLSFYSYQIYKDKQKEIFRKI